MTHTLHRQGTPESLAGDYCILAIPAQGINNVGSGEKLQKIKEVFLRHNPVNFGDIKRGNMYDPGTEEVAAQTEDGTVIHAVYRDRDTLIRVLKDLKEIDAGMSVVVSGLFDQVAESCACAGLKPHTLEWSLGVHGAVHRLPDPTVMEITCMCGHGQISSNLVLRMVRNIKAKLIAAEEAGKELARLCTCGVFNPARAAEILTKLAES